MRIGSSILLSTGGVWKSIPRSTSWWRFHTTRWQRLVRGMLSLFRRSDENRWWIRKKAAKKRCYTHRLKRKKHQRLAIACEICGRAEKELFPKVAWMVIIGVVIQTSRLMEKHDDKTEDFRCFQPAYQVPVANGQLRASLLPKRLKYFFFFFFVKTCPLLEMLRLILLLADCEGEKKSISFCNEMSQQARSLLGERASSGADSICLTFSAGRGGALGRQQGPRDRPALI